MDQKKISKLSGKDLEKEAFRICQEFLGSTWATIGFSDFNFSTVSGGLSNSLYCCALPDNIKIDKPQTPRKVLLRIYGPLQEDDPNVVVIEATTFTLLAERGLGPKLYGVFPGGRLEEFIPSRILSTDDIRRMSTSIARELAKIHALDVPIRKVPDLFSVYLKKWVDDIEQQTQNKYNKSFPLKQFYEEELDWMTKEMEQSGSPVVFCHNDLQGGNILLREDSPSEDDPRLVLIDFEFGAYNYRGFDIANQFCEWIFDYNTPELPHFTADFNKYPTEDQQTEYVNAYLDQLVSEGCLEASAIPKEREQMLNEVKLFAMSCNLLWSLWSEKMKFVCSLDFCHMAHGETRLNLFKKLKEKYLKKKASTCNGN